MFGTRWMAILFGIAFVMRQVGSSLGAQVLKAHARSLRFRGTGTGFATTGLGCTICAGDYSQWLRDKIKDGELADDVASAEKDEAMTLSESRQRIKEAIERRYTNPA
jgi:hypothetical protein